jgi:hypothetical protein
MVEIPFNTANKVYPTIEVNDDHTTQVNAKYNQLIIAVIHKLQPNGFINSTCLILPFVNLLITKPATSLG